VIEEANKRMATIHSKKETEANKASQSIEKVKKDTQNAVKEAENDEKSADSYLLAGASPHLDNYHLTNHIGLPSKWNSSKARKFCTQT
jgi:CHASE3 domain sensor protein